MQFVVEGDGTKILKDPSKLGGLDDECAVAIYKLDHVYTFRNTPSLERD